MVDRGAYAIVRAATIRGVSRSRKRRSKHKTTRTLKRSAPQTSIIDADVMIATMDLIEATSAINPHIVLDDLGEYFVGKIAIGGLPRESGGHANPMDAFTAIAQLSLGDSRCRCGKPARLIAPGKTAPPATSCDFCAWHVSTKAHPWEWKGACGAARQDVAWQ